MQTCWEEASRAVKGLPRYTKDSLVILAQILHVAGMACESKVLPGMFRLFLEGDSLNLCVRAEYHTRLAHMQTLSRSNFVLSGLHTGSSGVNAGQRGVTLYACHLELTQSNDMRATVK